MFGAAVGHSSLHTDKAANQTLVDGEIFSSLAGPRQRRFTIIIAGLSLFVFAAAVPFATVPLTPLPAFIPAYEAALVVMDVITAVFLLGQFGQRASPAVLVLAAGYLFDGMIIVPHALTFPGVMSPTGWLDAGVNTTAWLYMFWHGGFPLYVTAYVYLNQRNVGVIHNLGSPAIYAAVAGTLAFATALTLLATMGHSTLPSLMAGNTDAVGQKIVVLVVWGITAAALIMLLLNRPHSVLDLWLMAVMVAWLADIGLSAVFDAARYDLGFYAGRLYGLLAGTIVLGGILIDTSSLQRKLAAAGAKLAELNRSLAQRVNERTSELRASEERLRLMTDSVQDYSIIMLDPAGRVLTWNHGAQQLKGYTAPEIVGQSVERLHLQEDIAAGKVSQLLTRATVEGRCLDSGWRVRKDGTQFAADVVLTAMRDSAGELVGFTEITRDVTERRLAQQKILEQMERAEALLEASPDPVVIIDRTGRIAIVNARTEAVFGYPRRDLIGQSVEMLIPEWPRAEHIAQRTLDQQDPTTRPMATGSDLIACRRDGEKFSVDVALSPLMTPDGPLLISIIRDVTDRLRADAQLQQAQKMEAIGNLTGGMAHDFNNLLGIVIGNLDLLRDMRKDDADVDELAQGALDAACKGADLTRRLLAFARQQPLQPKRIDVNELVSGITKLLSRTLGEQVEISLDLTADPWGTVVDPAQLEAGLVNLATNSRDAMPNGGQLRIATRNRHLDADYAAQHAEVVVGDYVMIEVSDTGTGMPPEIISRIFEPFFTTKERGRGTGLGLAMVFGFMKQSHGHINVYSEPGKGTTFRLYLPRMTEDTRLPDNDESATSPARGNGEWILVVEDNPSLRRIVVRQLSELGYRVLEAENAAAALELLSTERVDLLMTDIVMPGGTDGVELAQQAQQRWPALKVLFTSGFAEVQINGRSKLLPARTELLTKPYRREKLAATVRKALLTAAS